MKSKTDSYYSLPMKSDAIRETLHYRERKWSCNAKLLWCGLVFSHLQSCTHTYINRLTWLHKCMHACMHTSAISSN